jgi:hypothetical protein
MILLPAMVGAQAASWHGVMDLHERLKARSAQVP